MDRDMVLVLKYGLMVRSMKEIGSIIKLMEKASSGTQMVIFMRETGLMIKQMGMENIFMSMELNTKDIGRTIYRMALA
jgi:hypothetical protein